MEQVTTPLTGVEANEALAAALYPDPPPPRAVDKAPNATVQAVRDADPTRVFYRPEDQLGAEVDAVFVAQNPAISLKNTEAQRVAFATVAADVGFGREDVSQLASFVAGTAAKPPTAEEQAAHQRTALKQLREVYGDGASEALADARALAQRDPRFTNFLNLTHLGNHPWVIARLAELGRAARARGQLK